jgi:mono/diheme cytochrome c family protein
MKRLLWSALLAAALLGACGASPYPEPVAADAARAAPHFPGVTLSELQQGRSLYMSRCGGCHALKRPVELPPAIVERLTQASNAFLATAAVQEQLTRDAAIAGALSPAQFGRMIAEETETFRRIVVPLNLKLD